MSPAAYEVLGRGYATTRRADPRIAARIHAALGDAATVVNVGAGTGNYEPTDRRVVAVEPARAMLAQRQAGAAHAVQAVAEHLPFPDRAFAAALCVLTVHHWRDRSAGLCELRRVAPRQVLFVFDPGEIDRYWLLEYFPQLRGLETERRAPTPADVALDLDVRAVEAVPVPADCTDGFGAAFWSRPEAYLDPAVRAGISSLAQLPEPVLDAGAARLRADLDDGTWDARHGHLRGRAEADLGYRLVVAGA